MSPTFEIEHEGNTSVDVALIDVAPVDVVPGKSNANSFVAGAHSHFQRGVPQLLTRLLLLLLLRLLRLM